MPRQIIGYAGNQPIYGDVPDPAVNLKTPTFPPQASTPITGGNPFVPQPSNPFTAPPTLPNDGARPDPTIPVGTPKPSTPITAGPAAPVAPDPRLDPRNIRARAEREAGPQAPVQTPNTAALTPGPPIQPQGKAPMVQDPYRRGQMTPQSGQDQARMAGQRRFLRGDQGSTF